MDRTETRGWLAVMVKVPETVRVGPLKELPALTTTSACSALMPAALRVRAAPSVSSAGGAPTRPGGSSAGFGVQGVGSASCSIPKR